MPNSQPARNVPMASAQSTLPVEMTPPRAGVSSLKFQVSRALNGVPGLPTSHFKLRTSPRNALRRHYERAKQSQFPPFGVLGLGPSSLFRVSSFWPWTCPRPLARPADQWGKMWLEGVANRRNRRKIGLTGVIRVLKCEVSTREQKKRVRL